MASRREYEMLFQLNAQLGSSYNTTFAKAQAQMATMQQRVVDLGKTQGNIAAYQKQQSAVEATRRKLEALEQQYGNIQREIEETEGFSSTLENRLLSKKQAIDKTSAALEQQARKSQQLGDALREAGVDTDHLAEENERLGAEINEVKNRQQGVIDAMAEGGEQALTFGRQGVQAVEALEQALVAAGIAKLLQEIGEGMVECARESIVLESAITGVYKTVDGTDQQLAVIRDDIRGMALDIPATTEEISGVAEAAGQLGIATDHVTGFTEVMINLSESTNLETEEAASSLAKFSNITGMAATEYSNLGSVVVDLGNNFATTEADIVAMAIRLASAGELAGLSEAEIMALATAMSSVGIQAEAGGTAMTQTISAIEKSVAEGGDTLKEFARIAGMSADEFASTWQSNPITAIQAFIAGIGELDKKGESAVIVLDELGLSGIRQSNMLKSLGLAADTLTGAVSTANRAWTENTALTEEAEKRYATTESRLAILRNAYSNLEATIGDVYMPTLKSSAQLGTELLGGMAEFVEKNPTVVKLITVATVGVAAFAASLTAYILVSKAAKAATDALTAAMNANPYMLATTAAVGITTAIIALAAATEDEAIPSVRGLTEAAREMKGVMDEANTLYEESVTATMAAANIADSYITKLEELEAAGLNTNEEQREYHNTLALLCQVVPELASSINLETDAIEGGTAALRINTEAWAENAKKQAYQAQLTSMYESYAAVLVEAEKNSIGLTKAEFELQAAQSKQAAAYSRMDTLLEEATAAAAAYNSEFGTSADAASFLTQEYYDLENSLIAINDEILITEGTIQSYEAAIEEGAQATAAAEEEIRLAEEAVRSLTGATADNSGAQAENATQMEQTQQLIADVNAQMSALTAAYTEAYTAAQESISGQYALWDSAAAVVATSASTINGALSSQITYWQDYNANLQSLGERSQDIEGLSDMIASFADGSTDSVNAVAGMATATDEELAAMVADWQTLQAEQDNVAASIADLTTNFSAEMDALQEEFAADIEAMNLGSEAAASARNTLQGFINGAYEMLPQVEAAYASIARSAMAAIDRTLDINSPSREMEWRAEMTWAGFINQTKAMEKDIRQAMTLTAQSGLDATDAAFAPTSAHYGSADRAPVSVSLSIHVDGNATEQTVQALNEYGEEFIERVRVAIAEIDEDNYRRAY